MKIDVEGLEDEVIAGLTRPLRALSLEFTTIQRDVAMRAIERLARLGTYRFNAALGESQQLEHREPLHAGAISQWIADLPITANSGDVYAALDPVVLRSTGERTGADAA